MVVGIDSLITSGPGEGSPGVVVQTSHHGELIQGPVNHRNRRITGLITLPRNDRFTVAHFQPKRGREIVVSPSYAHKARKAARWLLDDAGLPHIGGSLCLGSNITPGSGNGSSTADIVAALRAVAISFGLQLSPMSIQKIAWLIEGASDPIALLNSRSVPVYGSRTGEVIKFIPATLPAMTCLGFNAAPGVSVETEGLIGRESYTEEEVSEFASILRQAENGIRKKRVDIVASASTQSASLNQQHVALPNFVSLVRICREEGAFGLACSHSGTVAAAIFSPYMSGIASHLEKLAKRLAHEGCVDIGVFEVGGD